MIREKKPRDELREVKFPVPAVLAIKLHTLKIHEGRLIGDVVNEALEAYFARRVPRAQGEAEEDPER